MPSIAHLLLGTIVGISLYYISDGKFSKTHAFILMMNNYYGPDAGYAVGLGTFTHSLVFWPPFALVMAMIYHYIAKFSLKIDRIKNIELIELEEPKLTYLNTYLVVLAGGIMHIYTDGMLNWKGILMVFPPILGNEAFFPTLDDLFDLWAIGIIDPPAFISIFIGIMLIFGLIYVVVYFLKKETLTAGLFIIIHVALFMFFFYLVGNVATLWHPDAGAVIYVSLFWGAPLILCVLSTREFKFLKKEKQRKTLLSEEFIVGSLKIAYLILGIFMILEGIVIISTSEIIYSRALDAGILKPSFHSQLIMSLTLLSIFLMVMGIINIFLWRQLTKTESHNKNLLASSLILIFAGGIFITVSILGLFLNNAVIDYIFTEYEEIEVYISRQELLSLALAIEIILLSLGIIDLIGAIGMTLKIKILWKSMIYTHLITGWTVVGLVLACYLSEDSVKEQFNS